MKRILFSIWIAVALAAPVAQGPGSCNADAGRAFPLEVTADKALGNRQRVTVEARLSKEGRLQAEMTFQDNQDVSGVCAVAHVAIQDARGNVLEVHSLPKACVAEQKPFRTVYKTVSWEGEVRSPGHLAKAASLEVRIFRAYNDPLAEVGPGGEKGKALFE